MVEATWGWNLHTEIPSSKDAAHDVIEQLLQAVGAAGWEGRDYFHIQMAIEEALVNAVTHGNKESPDKVVELEFKVAAETVYMRIKDQGEGFCPDELPDPRDDEHLECTNGRGVMLIREMMTQVHYNDMGTEVTMVKQRHKSA